MFQGTPGDTTTRSASSKVARRCPPASSRMPWSRSLSASSGRSPSGLPSVTTTRAPRRARSSADATPDRASPTTTTSFPASSKATSPQLQRRDGEESEDEGHDQEADDDLGLRPADQLEVVVQRGHAEDAFLAQLERGHLQDHRQRLQHEHPADADQ